MKISSLNNNVSFNGLLLEKRTMSRKQEKIVNTMIDTINDSENAKLNLCSLYNGDIFISPNKDGESVDLKLLVAGGLTYNFVPEDAEGPLTKNIHVPKRKPTEENVRRLEGNIRLRTNAFMQRAVLCLVDDEMYSRNQGAFKNLEHLSLSDLLRKDRKLSYPENIPDAKCIIGTNQVETRDSLKGYFSS